MVDKIAIALRSPATIILGAGASLHPDNDLKNDWSGELPGMPSGAQLGRDLAKRFHVENLQGLPLTAQHAQTFGFAAGMRKRLSEIFSRSTSPLAVHGFCARLAKERNEDGGFPLFLSTNYDGLLEFAMIAGKVEFDLLYYDERREFEIGLRHVRYDPRTLEFSTSTLITNAKTYAEVDLELRPCILKIHGGIGRDDLQRMTQTGGVNPNKPTRADSAFVISEDDYIRYLACVDSEEFFPATIREHLVACHYLFLGHGLADWNLRVMMLQIIRNRWKGPSDYNIWAVKKEVSAFEQRWGMKNNIQIIEEDLKDFVPRLEKALWEIVEAA